MTPNAIIDSFGREITTIGEDVYRIKTTTYNSARYGPCEVCHKHCSEVFLQAHLKTTGAYVSSAFGHRECLEGIRVK